MNISLLQRIVPVFACTFPIGALAAACGSTDVPFGAETSAAPIVPTPPPGPDGKLAGVAPGTACEFGGFSWEAKPFALYPDEQTCLGDQWVRYDAGLGLWVGLTTCAIDETRVYLAASPEGTFAAAADWAGHGQDHCELVNAAFTLTNEDDITSGGCTDCSTGPNLPLEGLPAFARGNLGEPFSFVAVTPEWSHQVSRLRCGVQLGCATSPPPPPPPLACGVPYAQPWAFPNKLGCSGEVLAERSMSNSDDPFECQAFCSATQGTTCCHFDFESEGLCRATNGAPSLDFGTSYSGTSTCPPAAPEGAGCDLPVPPGPGGGVFGGCSGATLAEWPLSLADGAAGCQALCNGVEGARCCEATFGRDTCRATDGAPLADDGSDWSTGAAACGAATSPPAGLTCQVGRWNAPATSCTGNVLASGSMDNFDDPEEAGRRCASAGVAGSCCMYHLYGDGSWFLTDGVAQSGGRDCGDGSSCYAGGACSSTPSPAPGACGVPAGRGSGGEEDIGCDGNVLAEQSMNNSDDPVECQAFCERIAGARCCHFDLGSVGFCRATDGSPSLEYGAGWSGASVCAAP
ncbi:hypothetical protein [Sorangium sp. So ce1153]|uniref:hypothetical protein n=1 Tax=Sorangium sp. So ce1153 TaxID=3133333 RepID=UPI003F61BF7F